ncbi:hypothetical protein [Streptobacillus moniliformis]|uniref:hypothetical protein n=1 Tax=Streptobacillus moniliformis TaxID=34105 RepID=UPI0009BE5445|nr:hypothetical protein [Streptobacillus moniliformis]
MKKKFNHSIKLISLDNEIKIKEESLKIQQRNKIKEIKIINGEIILNTIKKDEIFENKTFNLLDKKSIITIAINLINEVKIKDYFDFIDFYFNISVFSQTSDDYRKFINTKEGFEKFKDTVISASYKDFDDFELTIPKEDKILLEI